MKEVHNDQKTYCISGVIILMYIRCYYIILYWCNLTNKIKIFGNFDLFVMLWIFLNIERLIFEISASTTVICETSNMQKLYNVLDCHMSHDWHTGVGSQWLISITSSINFSRIPTWYVMYHVYHQVANNYRHFYFQELAKAL